MAHFFHGNRRLHYLDQGRGDPVLLLHGLGSCAQDWAPQIAALSNHFRVIALDQRGHGDSAPARAAYQMVELAQDAAALMSYLGLARYQLVGFSMGGMVAFELALLCPDQVQSLTVINSGPQVAGLSWHIHLQLYLRLAVIRVLGMRRMARLIGRHLFPQPAQHHLRATFEHQMAGMDASSYRYALRAIVRFSVLSQLHRLSLPVLVLAGDQDYTPVAVKSAYVRQLANAQLVVIEHSRHASPLDQPEQVNGALITFLTRYQELQSVAERQVKPAAD